MEKDEVRAGLESLAATRKSFSLMDLSRALSYMGTLEELQAEIWPLIPETGFAAQVERGKVRFERRGPQKTISPDPGRTGAVRGFLRAPGVPGWWEDRVEAYIGKKTGKSWDDPAVRERIRQAILAQKAQYWKEGDTRRIGYRKGYAVMAYLAYQAPGYFIQAEHLLLMLLERGFLKEGMRILDAGTGPGTFTSAILDFSRRIGGFSADIFPVERSDEFADAFRELHHPGREDPGGIRIHPPLQGDLSTLPQASLPTSLDLAVFQNVLNEIPDERERLAVLAKISGLLAPGGLVLIAEPADYQNATQLRKGALAAVSAGALALVAPCRYPWGLHCDPASCWSFEEQPPVAPPPLMRKVAEAGDAYRFLNTDIKYSWVLLREKTAGGDSVRPPEGRYTRLSALRQVKGRTVDLLVTVMSPDIGDTATHVFKICDGTAKKPVFAVLPSFHTTAENAPLLSRVYGDVAVLSGVTVRFNTAKDAWNILVTRQSRVTPLPAGAEAIPDDLQ
ncbi:SAM-dependent methyltransferase [Methanolinea mesophila]|uniref:methyltransferase domain-containing protein n=1 Tax=Methanolinea mesophila TaxID=547055 RepID=UPI001AE74288|nr:class I SAM-dependent methyltransferase [Methanolinea mesophila]MBP1927499.1 SAM-dependent methyltransferase [Methanolinea mesophila]